MYESVFNLTAENIKDKYLYALSGAQIGQDYPTLSDTGKYKSVTIDVPVNTKIRLTGLFFVTSEGLNCYQVYVQNLYGNSGYGYVWEDNIKYWSTSDVSSDVAEAQTMLNDIIESNKRILDNNLFCARALQLCKENGVALPIEFRNQLYTLHSNLIKRNEELIKHVSSYEIGESPNAGSYGNVLDDFMQNPGIGLIFTGTATIIIIGVIALATIATTIAVLKLSQKSGHVDLKYSNDLMAALIKYLPKQYFNQLMSENEGFVKIANKAIGSASGSSFMTNLKYLAFGFLGLLAVDKFVLNRNSAK